MCRRKDRPTVMTTRSLSIEIEKQNSTEAFACDVMCSAVTRQVLFRVNSRTPRPSRSLRLSTCPAHSEVVDPAAKDPTEDNRLGSMLPDAKFFGCEDIHWTNLATDVSDCGTGDIVVYRSGEGDPNELIAEAMARGASAILTEQLLPCPLPQCIVGSVDRALATIAAADEGAPDRKVLTVGVLGTSGKTSVCLLAATVTNAMGIRTAFQCDLGSHDGVLSETPSRGLPGGAELIRWMSEVYDCGSRIALIEIDEASARQGHYDALQFDVLIVAGRSSRCEDFGPSGIGLFARSAHTKRRGVTGVFGYEGP